MPNLIDNFEDEFHFLSNFYYCKVTYEGILYPSSEHAYQAAKSTINEDRMSVKYAGSPAQAKQRGRHIKMRPDWDDVKLGVMEDILRIKFGRPLLKEKLLLTKGFNIVEGNHWGDTYWGVCRGKGSNHLGQLLMKIREEITSL